MSEMTRVVRPGQPPEESLVPGAPKWAQARCGLPGCGGNLYFERFTGAAIYLHDTVSTMAEPETESWEIVCENGHKIVVPEGCADSEQFGVCQLEPDEHEPGDESCPCYDLKRLRSVMAPEAWAVVPDNLEGLS